MAFLLDFLSSPGVAPFSAALLGMLAILAIETLLLVVAGLHLDSLLPEFHLHADANVDGLDHGLPQDLDLAHWATSWLHVGKVPMVVLLSLALGGFASGGFLIQSLAGSVLGGPLSLWLVVPAAGVFALLMVRYMAAFFGRIMPKDETSSVSLSQFLGQVAEINQGTARRGLAAEGKLVDGHGQAHFFRVIPEADDDTFPTGTRVLLIARDGNTFTAVRAEVGPPSASLPSA